MDQITRYAVYYAPRAGDFADAATRWLGRDAVDGAVLPQSAEQAVLTAEPRRYGFHATLKPPFRLAPGQSADGLHLALALLARDLAPVTLPALRLTQLGGFLALIPAEESAELQALAARVVAELDPFRAAPTTAEIARRNPDSLPPRARDLLARWGYPWVMEEFRFHLTLTGRLDPAQAETVMAAAAAHFGPVLPQPCILADLCLFGEGAGAEFRLLHRYALSG